LIRSNSRHLFPGITPTPSRPSPEPPELDLTVDGTPPPPPRPIQVWRSHPHRLLMLLRALDRHVRRPFAGNGDVPPRPPPLLAVGNVPSLLVEPHLFQLSPRTLLIVPSRSHPAGDLAAGGNMPEPTAGRRRGLAGAFL
jgi:hypothetical protein